MKREIQNKLLRNKYFPRGVEKDFFYSISVFDHKFSEIKTKFNELWHGSSSEEKNKKMKELRASPEYHTILLNPHTKYFCKSLKEAKDLISCNPAIDEAGYYTILVVQKVYWNSECWGFPEDSTWFFWNDDKYEEGPEPEWAKGFFRW